MLLRLAVSCLLLCSFVVVAAPALPPEAIQIRTLLREGKAEAAIEYGESTLESNPGQQKTWLWLGNAYGRMAIEASLLRKAGWAGKCRDAYEKAVELDPRDPDARFALLQYYEQAPGFMGGGREKAQAQVDALTAISATWGHLGRALLLQRDEAFPEAEAAYVAALRADPDHYRARLALISFHIGQRQFPAARAVVAEALARNAGDAVALYMSGRIAIDDGLQLEEGIRNLDAFLALTERPDELPVAGAWWRKGLLLEKSGRRDEAVAALQQAVRIDARLEGAKKDLERLQS